MSFPFPRRTYLKFVLAALGPEGVGAADEQQLLGRQRRDDSNVILALVLKREGQKRGSVSTIFFAKGGGDAAAVRSVVYAPERILIKVLRHSCERGKREKRLRKYPHIF